MGMKLTDEQRRVVEIDAGSHLVLAPPGSGKTEILSQRILHAMRTGVNPERMLCATFTNRAAYEMRSRVEAQGAGVALPEVGNLHHFCFRFLRSVGRLSPAKHVLDDCEQLSFAKEVVDVLREELKTGKQSGKETRGVTVLRSVKGVVKEPDGPINELRIGHLHGLLEEYFASCAEKDRSPYPAMLSAMLIAHQRRMGIPLRYLRAMPPELYELDGEGVVRALSGCYAALKRRFCSVDFDDLINEAYLYLERSPLSDERKFRWVMIDEVQDLNTLQWQIVRGLTSKEAVSVYFGDAEQAIFSFLGASEESFASAVRGCERHFFRRNFRATPHLLEMLMRYSLDALRSEWEFLPHPAAAHQANGVVGACKSTSGAEVMQHVRWLVDSGTASNVAILVRRNIEADALEAKVRELGFRYSKVSGIDLFSLAAMRDFLAYVSVVVGTASRTDWARLLRRFALGVHSHSAARYLVRGMFAAGYDPAKLWDGPNRIPLLPNPRSRRLMWAWRNRRKLTSFRDVLKDAVSKGRKCLCGNSTVRALFEIFADAAFGVAGRYSLRELWPEVGRWRDELDPAARKAAEAHSRERIGKFLRYVEFACGGKGRSLGEVLAEEWGRLRQLKEADLLVGDEKIVLSTIHKAKGRQFDAVVIPDVSYVLDCAGGSSGEADRLLYVAMSRAKRHLMLFGCPDTPVFSRLGPCFEKGYVNYYLRKAMGSVAKGDWLAEWERLAELNEAGRCDVELALKAVESGNGPIVRMALKVMRHDLDRASLRRRYLEMARSLAVPFDCLETLVDCLSDCFGRDPEVLGVIRMLALASARSDVCDAALRYACSAAEEASLRADAMAAMSDALYCRSAELRVAAATALFDLGEGRWAGAVKGTAGDFERLGRIAAPSHEAAIREIIAAAERHGDSAYGRKLRRVVFLRAAQALPSGHGLAAACGKAVYWLPEGPRLVS